MPRRLLVALLALAFVGAAPLPAPLLAYAGTLRAFDPALDDETALRLAARAVTEADAARIDARLIVALVAIESSWNPRAVSRAGARGLGQLMPKTANALHVDPADPDANLHGTVAYLAALLVRFRAYAQQERYIRALSAYNAGIRAVERFGGLPPYPETQLYVRRVIGLWRRLCGA